MRNKCDNIKALRKQIKEKTKTTLFFAAGILCMAGFLGHPAQAAQIDQSMGRAQIDQSIGRAQIDQSMGRAQIDQFMGTYIHVDPLFVYNMPSAPAKTIAKGIDISKYNGDINFTALKEDVDFVIIRCGYGMDERGQDDANYFTYVKGCHDHGIPYGIYLYSYATDTEKARSEANHALRLIKEAGDIYGASPQLPVFLDMEDDKTGQSQLSASMKGQIAKTFTETIEAAGYKSGIYANYYWWKNYLTDSFFDGQIKWVADYNTSCRYTKPYDMWQCTNKATIDGQNGTFDYNYMVSDLFKDYVSLLSANFGDIADQSYTGKQIKPDISLSYEGKPLVKNKDYQVSYGKNLNPGKGTITITGIGDYRKCVTRDFYIVPAKAAITKTSAQKKAVKLTFKKLKGASGYEIAYKKNGETAFKTVRTGNTSKTINKLTSKKKYTFKVRAYVTVNNVRHYGAYSSSKTVKVK